MFNSIEDKIIDEGTARIAAELNAERAKTAEQRQREKEDAELEAVSTELAPLLKSPSFNGARIKELVARQAELLGKLEGPPRNPMYKTVQHPRVVKTSEYVVRGV